MTSTVDILVQSCTLLMSNITDSLFLCNTVEHGLQNVFVDFVLCLSGNLHHLHGQFVSLHMQRLCWRWESDMDQFSGPVIQFQYLSGIYN